MGFVSTSKLCNLLEASEEEVMECVREGRTFREFPVHEWAQRGQEGEVYGFEVPQEIQKELGRDRRSSSGLLSVFLD